MNEQTKEAIIVLLNETAHPVELLTVAPHDFASLKDSILQMELLQEIEALRTMLLDLNTFEEKFKQRCAFRQTNTEQTIPFSDTPESTTNELYWQIVTLVFKPQNMGEMLKIVVPQIKIHVTVSLPQSVPAVFKEGLKQIEPVVEQTSNLDALIDPPTLEAFTHFVLSGDRILNVYDITNFPLRLHSELHTRLERLDPKLAEKLYTHNNHLRILAEDILILNNKGITPKTAIEQLIQGLNLAGTRVTGSVDATRSSEEPIKRFFNYFNRLPGKLKESLLALRCDNKTVADILKKLETPGECVETIASLLKQMLQQNVNCLALNSPPSMTQKDLKDLEDKYKAGYEKDNAVLGTRKKIPFIQNLPAQLVKKAVQSIAPKTHCELIMLLLNFSPAFYDAFWEHVTLTRPYDALARLAFTLKLGLFNSEQRQGLATAIVRHYSRFQLHEPILSWAATTNDPVFLEAALSSYPENQRMNELKNNNFGVNTQWARVILHPELIKTILKLLPEDHRLSLVIDKAHGILILHHSAQYPETLKAILMLLPKDKRLHAIMISNCDKTLLYYVAGNPELFKALLALLPENHRLTFLKTDFVDKSILERLIEARVEILSSEEEFKDSFVPDFIKVYTYLAPKGSRFNLGHFSQNDKEAGPLFEAIKKCNSFEDTISLLNHYIKENPDSPLTKGLLIRVGRTEFSSPARVAIYNVASI